MKKLIIILALISVIGCATQKEAMKKGYLNFDKTEAITSGILMLITGFNYPVASDGCSWNINLMRVNYPECFNNYDPLNDGLYVICVQDKVKEEGNWR